MSSETLSPKDIDILRRLAARRAEIAADPVNLEKKEAWYAHDAGPGGRVMVLAEHGAVRDENRGVDESALECEGKWARGLEKGFRNEAYVFETLQDDQVVEPVIHAGWHVRTSDYGVQKVDHHSDDPGIMGSRVWDAPIKDLDKDFDKLHPRTYSVDREATAAGVERLENIFGGILDVSIRGGYYWTLGMTWTAIDLIGLQDLMLSMYDNPEGLHRLMAFLRDDHLAYTAWLEAEGLYTLNNSNNKIGSGSVGYSRNLPQTDWQEGDPVRRKDLWMLSESQETVGVGPDQFAEFIFPYQRDIVEKFGKCYYGCCEPVNNRWHILKQLPNLARISVSPWADEAFMAEACGTEIVYSRKPKPTLVSTSVFDEDAIRADIQNTLQTAKGCRIELIMKDVHTLNNDPARLPRWVVIAREEIEKAGN